MSSSRTRFDQTAQELHSLRAEVLDHLPDTIYVRGPGGFAFAEIIRKWLACYADGGAGLAMAFIDLDIFKTVNDDRGYDAGGQVPPGC